MYYIVSCERKGQILKPCGGSYNNYTCDDALLKYPHVCLLSCKPGCECLTGKSRLIYGLLYGVA